MTVVLISFIVIVLTSLKPRKMGGDIHVTQQMLLKAFLLYLSSSIIFRGKLQMQME